jgi:hypothetical protein
MCSLRVLTVVRSFKEGRFYRLGAHVERILRNAARVNVWLGRIVALRYC